MSGIPVSFKKEDELIPIYLELPEEMIFGEMIFDYATHYSLDPSEVGRRIDISDYYEFLAHRNRRKEVEIWFMKRNE